MMIHPASAVSAREMLVVLSPFEARLVEMDARDVIVVDLAGDVQIVEVLNALQRYVTERADGAARMDFNGRSFTMHPEPVHPGGL